MANLEQNLVKAASLIKLEIYKYLVEIFFKQSLSLKSLSRTRNNEQTFYNYVLAPLEKLKKRWQNRDSTSKSWNLFEKKTLKISWNRSLKDFQLLYGENWVNSKLRSAVVQRELGCPSIFSAEIGLFCFNGYRAEGCKPGVCPAKIGKWTA